MIDQKIEIKDNGLIERLQQYPEIVIEENRTFLDTALARILRMVKASTPVGVTGQLRRSIFSEIQGRKINLTGTIDTPLPYAEAVEQGTEIHWVPIEPLKIWAMRTFGDEQIAYAIRGKIAKKGTKGHFMFKKAFDQAKEFVAQQQHALAERIRNRIEGM